MIDQADLIDPSALQPPRWPLSLSYWAPWTITRFWLPRWIRGSDEWHNYSYGLVLPFGAFIVFRVRYRRTEGAEHLNAYHRAFGWDGIRVMGCAICDEIHASVD